MGIVGFYGKDKSVIVRIKHCNDADKEHEKNIRQYAHVDHEPGIICVCKEFSKLPNEHQIGIIGHEIGHLLGENDELGADEVGGQIIGEKIKRTNSLYGENLQST